MYKRLLKILAILATVYLAIYFLFGSKGGRGFFSPETLQSRSQSEILFAPPGIPLYRSAYDYHQLEMVKFLIDEGYWKPIETAEPRWIVLFHWNEMWRDGYSDFYRQFISSKHYWMEWSKTHPQEAAKFWPRVLELLREDNQEQVMEMMFEMRMKAARE